MKTKLSLKDKLYSLIKAQGYLSFKDMCEWVSEEGFKVNYAERALRDLVNLDKLVEYEYKTSKRNKPYISGYKLPDTYVPVKEPQWEFIKREDGITVAVQK